MYRYDQKTTNTQNDTGKKGFCSSPTSGYTMWTRGTLQHYRLVLVVIIIVMILFPPPRVVHSPFPHWRVLSFSSLTIPHQTTIRWLPPFFVAFHSFNQSFNHVALSLSLSLPSHHVPSHQYSVCPLPHVPQDERHSHYNDSPNTIQGQPLLRRSPRHIL